MGGEAVSLVREGHRTLEEVVGKQAGNAGDREATRRNEKGPGDVLIGGGGPAGAAGAVYAARKGIRVGGAAERSRGGCTSVQRHNRALAADAPPRPSRELRGRYADLPPHPPIGLWF